MICKRSLRRLSVRHAVTAAMLAVTSLACAGAGVAQRATAKPPDFRKGVLVGRVLDPAGMPVPGATVAVVDDKGRVGAWTTTNAQGEYAIACDPVATLHMNPSHRRGLLEQVCRGLGDVVTAPVKVVGGVVTQPGKTIRSVAESVAVGNPAPTVAQVILPAVTDPKSLKNDTTRQARVTGVQTAFGDGPASAKGHAKELPHGELTLSVTAPGRKACTGAAGAFWLEPPVEDKAAPVGIQAWIDTVTLAPEAGPAKSAIIHQAYTLADPHVDPPLAPPGAPVGLSVKLLRPPGELRPVRIFARENRSHAAIELQPGAGASADIFTGTLPLDAKMATGETPITFVALRADPVEVRFDRKKADPMLLFVKQLDEMDPAKPYLYDPRIMASENRMVAKLTVLDPKQATQPGQLPASALKPPAAQPAAPAPQPAGPAK